MKKAIAATRAYSLTATMLPAVVILFLGKSFWNQPNLALKFLISTLAIGLLQISVNLFNDAQDFESGVDSRDPHAGSGVIQKGWFSTKQLRKGALISFFAAGLLATFLFLQSPIWVTGLALVGAILSIQYSLPPLNLKYRGLGDPLVFLMCGPLLCFGFSGVYFAQIIPGTLPLGCALGFAALLILHSNNLADIDNDLSAGVKTLAGRLGFRRSIRLWLVYALGVCVSSILFSVWASIMLIPFLLVTLRNAKIIFIATSANDRKLIPLRVSSAQAHILLCLGFIFLNAFR